MNLPNRPSRRQTKRSPNTLTSAATLLVSTLLSAAATADHDVAMTTVVEGLTAPVTVRAHADGTLFIAEQHGLIQRLTADGTLDDQPVLDIRDRVIALDDGFEERGLLGFALHPEFGTNRRLYVTYTAPRRATAPDNFNYTRVVSEFTVQEEADATLETERVLLSLDWPSRKHNGGALAFGPDDYLYIGLGDGGGIHGLGPKVLNDAYSVPVERRIWDALAQDKTTLFGKILRIDVDGGFPGYAIPADNPLVGKPGRDEIYAWGFRNPYRIAFDGDGSGSFYVSATAEVLYEAVYRVEKPGNYGWALREGSHCLDRGNPFKPPIDCAEKGADGESIQVPVVEYPNMAANRPGVSVGSAGVGSAVVAAVHYRGEAVPAMKDFLVVADWSRDFKVPSGQLFVSKPQPPGSLWPIRLLTRIDARIVGLSQDGDGEILVLTNENLGPKGTTGKIFRLTPK